MKNLRLNVLLNNKLKVYGLAFFLFALISCGNASTNPITDESGVNLDKSADVKTGKIVLSKDPAAELEKAKKDGKAVFLVITGAGAVDLDKAIATANEAKGKVSKSIIIQMDKDDAANSALVTKLGVASVPVPFFIVVSPNGVPVAGYQAVQTTSDILVSSIPAPKQDEVLLAIWEKRPAFIVVSKKKLTDKTTVLENCKSACLKIASKPSVIEVDYEDEKEASFIKQLGIASLNDKTITVVVNSSGQITDTYEGIALETALVASANKVPKSSGCAPGACGGKKSCGK